MFLLNRSEIADASSATWEDSVKPSINEAADALKRELMRLKKTSFVSRSVRARADKTG